MLKHSVRSRESQHKFVEMIAKLGVKAGFKVYADLEGWREPELPFDLEENRLERVYETTYFYMTVIGWLL